MPESPSTPRPLVIGIAGGTGAGKTTIARTVVAELAGESVALIEHDHYYRDRPDLEFEARALLNYDHPDSLESELLADHLDTLCRCESIQRPNYDFTLHRRTDHTTRVDPARVVVVEGILIFAEPALRERFDVKVFVDTPADIRVLRRIRRDMERRARQFDDIRRQYLKTVRPMHEAFVEPSRRFADVIIPEGGNNKVAVEMVVERLRKALRG
ncbi:MAG: uridine kinase [Deltaproteobacteria bacterium]|nr:uridine kinase [Deltaproteobacteria bacterium]